MGSKLSRRRLFAYSALIGVAATAAYSVGWWWFKVRQGDTEDLIVSVLRRHLRGLPVLEKDMRDFAQALQPRFAEHARLAQLGMFGPLYERFNVIRFVPGSATSFRYFEDLIVGEFLLSTDFFSAEREQDAEVQYFGARDTKRLICNNPFANFDE
jgi:hypothetical protein